MQKGDTQHRTCPDAAAAAVLSHTPTIIFPYLLQLYVRRRFFYPPSRKDSYFSQVVHHVRAETQVPAYYCWSGRTEWTLAVALVAGLAAGLHLMCRLSTAAAVCTAPTLYFLTHHRPLGHPLSLKQERLHTDLLASGWLTDAERDVLRWGRNATGR